MRGFICFCRLIQRELFLFYKEGLSVLINNLCIVMTNVVVFGYFFSPSEVSSHYGVFIMIGMIATAGWMQVVSSAVVFADDIKHRTLDSYMILPIPSIYVLVAFVVSWAIESAIIALAMIPLGKALLWSQWDWSTWHLGKFVPIFFSSNLLYGVFGLWVGSLVTTLRTSNWIWYRLINPLFMFSGFYYSWHTIYHSSQTLGILHLINPILYTVEGLKGAMIPGSYLPFWSCLGVLWVFIILLWCDAEHRLKKKIHYI